jgi:uncharacterized damage-inducible protein DinB
MKDYYLNLIDYNQWANNLIYHSLSENQITDPKIFSLFSHLIIAEILWFNRVKNEKYEFKDFWQMLTLREMEVLFRRSSDNWRNYLNKIQENDLQESCSYINSKGIGYKNTLAQIITHVINHSTYHRAQIASLLRAENIEPPLTDYIAFFR